MAPSETEKARQGKRKRGQPQGAAPERPPEGETLDALLQGAARACRERGREETAQVLKRLTKDEGE